jgi:hypothetical protein
MAELTELADPEQASCVNHRRRRDVSDCVCNPVDIAQIERQVTMSRIGDGRGPAADPGGAPTSRKRRSTIAAPMPELAPVTSASGLAAIVSLHRAARDPGLGHTDIFDRPAVDANNCC